MNDTIAALATPAGESAIAVIRMSGSECERICKDSLALYNTEPRKAYLRSYKDTAQNVLDDVVCIFYKAPASYTGEDCLEISCHGNPFIVHNILSDLMARGIRGALAGEFTRRAFLNDKMDLSQAEAVALVIGARSSRSLHAARRQLEGSLGEKISAESAKLVEILSQIEAYIDFPDDDLPPEDAKRLFCECEKLSSDIDRLLDTSRYTSVIHQGLNIPIVGEPNAGKSSIMNLMLGNQRAIVSDEAGTTRDFIVEKTVMGDFAANLTDTAGLREAEGEIERLGIEKTLEKIAEADVIFLALDSSKELPKLPLSAMSKMTPKNTLIILNKCDLSDSNPNIADKVFPNFAKVRVSCRDGSGVTQIKDSVIKLVNDNNIFPSSDDALVGARHIDALTRASSAIKSAMEKIDKAQADVFAASDLRAALDALGEIVGKTDNEAILDSVFSKFCIGK